MTNTSAMAAMAVITDMAGVFERQLVHHCSPTLAGLKTGSLFSTAYASPGELRRRLGQWNRELNRRGVFLTPLRMDDGKALVYVYRPVKLSRDLAEEDVSFFLRQHGYGGNFGQSPGAYIRRLRRRIRETESFPHEVGLFLGYPLEDVRGFIENAGQNSKCCGCWKVYCNECEAKKLFAKFKKCAQIYRKRFQEGVPVRKLTVA